MHSSAPRCGPLAVVGVLLLAVPSAAGQATAAPQSLAEALSAGRVTATLRGTGGSSGDSIELEIAKTASALPGILVLSVAPGTVLQSSSPSAQNMVIAQVRGRMISGSSFAPSTRIEVSTTTPVRYLLEAYCTEFAKDNPSESITFTLRAPDPALACIIREGAALSTEARQAAIWSYTDRVTFAKLNEKFPVTQADWAAAQIVIAKCTPDRHQ